VTVERPAARILLLDAADRVLLFRFVAPDRPAFWATPGGALDPGESYAEAARRELFEETGVVADPGPEICRRQVAFTTLEGVAVEADERYFAIRAPTTDIRADGHTDLERRVMQDWRWFARDEIAGWPERIWPEDLAEMLEQLR
jgi:8-oxo-dGTP pyrophosphatase MutT (NUDIX family)